MYSTKAKTDVSRQNNDLNNRICATKEKLDYYTKSYLGKNTSVIYEGILLSLIQLLLTICNSEAILSYSEWAYDIGLWRTLDIMNQRHVSSLKLGEIV